MDPSAQRGIIIHAGGSSYCANAYVASRMLRFTGCQLPIQWWIKDRSELTPYMPAAARVVGASIKDCSEVRRRFNHPELGGWERKPYSILHSPFAETLLLDADNFVVRDPTYLFEDPEYLEHGALFWPDLLKIPASHRIWSAAGIKPDDQSYRFQGGQQIVNIERCRFEMMVTMDLNFDSSYWYSNGKGKGFTYGEQDLYRIAWRMLGSQYGMIPTKAQKIKYTLLEFDRLGRRVFQHRVNAKLKMEGGNVSVPDFWFEERCFKYLREIQELSRQREQPPICHIHSETEHSRWTQDSEHCQIHQAAGR